jgi:response regulator RpfG family c-di-GMP phosphodiesterase
MKVLIVDDIEELVEVLALMVQGIYPHCQILSAFDGAQAIELIENHPDLDLVLCDYNMPFKNGGEVFQFLRSKNSQTSFVLVSTVRTQDRTEFRGDPRVRSLPKPFSDEELESVIESFHEKAQVPAPASAKNNGYIPIPVEIVRKIVQLDAPIYLKLSEQNFVKILNSETRLKDGDLERIVKKGVDLLWIQASEYSAFIAKYKKEILAREAWKELADSDAASALAVDHEVILGAGKSFGWSKETVELAVENVKQVTKMLQRHPNFKEVARRLSEEKHSRLSTLSVLVAVACTAILQELGWESEITRQKMTFAALLHDMELNEDLLATMITILNEAEISEFELDPSLKVILEHPLKTAEMLYRWPLCPPDVDVIIRQHHERPDGKGFPAKLDAFRISPLAAVLIIAEDMVFHTVDNLGGEPKEYLLSKRDFYSKGEFKNIFEAAIRSLSDAHLAS